MRIFKRSVFPVRFRLSPAQIPDPAARALTGTLRSRLQLCFALPGGLLGNFAFTYFRDQLGGAFPNALTPARRSSGRATSGQRAVRPATSLRSAPRVSLLAHKLGPAVPEVRIAQSLFRASSQLCPRGFIMETTVDNGIFKLEYEFRCRKRI
jgi:hypothetical protein